MASLRKQVRRGSPEKYEAVVEFLAHQRREDTLMTSEAKSRASKKESLLRQWQCHKCDRGYLTLKLWDHPLKGILYYRKCTACPHRTQMQPYTDKVDGLKDDDVKS